MSRPATSGVPFDGLIVDLDGVVWIGGEPIVGSVEALKALRRSGVPFVFLTNDPTGSRADYAERLAELGVPATESDVVTAGSALAALVRDRERPGRTAFVIGSAAFKSELACAGLELLRGEAGGRAEVVVVGGHPRFNYAELRRAAQAVRRGASFYAAGRDATFPMPGGPWPATGAILAAVETAAGARATAVGKPEPYMFQHARTQLVGCRAVAIVGDNLASDITGGARAGMTTILVLTGTATRDDVEVAGVKPDHVFASLAELVDAPRSPT